MRKVYIVLGTVLLLLLSFTFIPFGVDYEAVVLHFDSVMSKAITKTSRTSKNLKEDIIGENRVTGDKISLVFPFKPDGNEKFEITSYAKERRSFDPTTDHTGTDIASYGDSTGRELVACTNGIIVINMHSSSFGNTIVLSDPITHLYYRYAHMRDRCTIPVGSEVQAGQLIGHCGTTGNSTSAHLHFEIFVPDLGDSNGIPSKYLFDKNDALYKKWVDKFHMFSGGKNPRHLTSIFAPGITYRDINFPVNAVSPTQKDSMGFPTKFVRS